jgi:hypothetical protein
MLCRHCFEVPYWVHRNSFLNCTGTQKTLSEPTIDMLASMRSQRK